MSHAAAVWIPGSEVDFELLEDAVRHACLHEGLRFEVFVRDVPAATCVVAPLDERDDLQMDFQLLNRAAASLARKLQRRVFALYAFFGSGDWMMVTAFDESSEEAWCEASSDDVDPADLEELSSLVGAEVSPVALPYWRLIADAAPGVVTDLLGVGLKPALDLGDIEGWVSRRVFSTPRAEKKPPVAQSLDFNEGPAHRREVRRIENLALSTIARLEGRPVRPRPEETSLEELSRMGDAAIAELARLEGIDLSHESVLPKKTTAAKKPGAGKKKTTAAKKPGTAKKPAAARTKRSKR